MIRFLTIFLVLLLIATSAVLYVTKNKTSEENEGGKASIVGGFSLVNQDNKPTNNTDFRGRVMLVFFGFTSCPDMCPVTSATFAKTLELLGEQAKNVAPIFISVDPARDTPAVLKTYLTNFDSRIIGLTGSEEQIEQAASAYKSYFSKSGDNDEKINHSSFVFVMDKNGVYVQHFPYNASAEELASAVLRELK